MKLMNKQSGFSTLLIAISSVVLIAFVLVGLRVFKSNVSPVSSVNNSTANSKTAPSTIPDDATTKKVSVYENHYLKFNYPTDWMKSSNEIDTESYNSICFRTPEPAVDTTKVSDICAIKENSPYAVLKLTSPIRSDLAIRAISEPSYLKGVVTSKAITTKNGLSGYRFNSVLNNSIHGTVIRLAYPNGQWIEMGYTFNPSAVSHEEEINSLVDSVTLKSPEAPRGG